MDQLEAMRVFVTVAKLGSFADAARQLRVSPSVVTRTIAQLEDHLDQTILGRTTRSVRLTERGKLYFESCEQILDSVAVAERRVRGEDAAPSGTLAVTAPVIFGRLHVLPIIEGLLAEHPALRVRLVLSDRNAHVVDEGLDAAIRIGTLADTSMIAIKLTTVTRVVVASPAYLARRGTPATVAELEKHSLVAFEGIEATREWQFRGAASVRVEPRLAVTSIDAAIAAAEAGIGITRVLSYQVEDAIRAKRLVPLLAAHAPPALPVSLLYPARRAPSPSVAVLLIAAKSYFADL